MPPVTEAPGQNVKYLLPYSFYQEIKKFKEQLERQIDRKATGPKFLVILEAY